MNHQSLQLLSNAVLQGDIEIIQTLLRDGADVGPIEKQPWIFGWCLYLEHEPLLKNLILAGLDIKTKIIDYEAMICENYQDPDRAEKLINQLSILQDQLADQLQFMLGEVFEASQISSVLRLLPKLKKQDSTPDIEVLIKEHGITIELAEKLYNDLSDPESELSRFHQNRFDDPSVFSESFTPSLRP